jgi:CDP-glucose 4,6-dehydratase
MLQMFHGKRVLVTGDTGFKGSWLALWLHILGAEVLGLALPPESPDDHFCVSGLNKLVDHVDADIRDAVGVNRAFTEFQPDFVFHLAAQPLVRRSYDDPKTTFDTNVSGSVNILEAVRATESVRTLIYVTSDKCYRNREWVWGYRENDELGGRDPYSASKAAAEIVFSSYRDSFFRHRRGFGAASVRAGNVIGGGDWALDRIVPDCIRSLRRKCPIVVRSPHSVRPWQHVLDALYGYLLLAQKLVADPKEYSGSWNFGPDEGSVRSVQALARTLVAVWGEGSIEFPQAEDPPSEARLLLLNCDKAHQQLDWHPLWHFDRAVGEAVHWYREWSRGEEARDLSHAQINMYMKERKLLDLQSAVCHGQEVTR